MRKHNGMRPQDVLILLKISSFTDTSWRYSDLAKSLHISQSEVAEGLHRSMQARLVDETKKGLFHGALLEFLVHGLKYVFPVMPGAIVRGVPTAHSAPPLASQIEAQDVVYVWPDANGQHKGQAINPLYPSAVKAAQEDDTLYQLLAVTDALRVGRRREQQLAEAWLQQFFREAVPRVE